MKRVLPRVTIDVALPTAIEILDCLILRAGWYVRRRRPVPHLTMIALRMLCETIGRDLDDALEETLRPRPKRRP